MRRTTRETFSIVLFTTEKFQDSRLHRFPLITDMSSDPLLNPSKVRSACSTPAAPDGTDTDAKAVTGTRTPAVKRAWHPGAER